MLEIRSLPAKQGDALWIRWGDEAAPHQMFVDMGTESIGKKIRARIEALPEDQRRFDLLVISHIDADHIGGVLTAIAEADEALPGFGFDEIWFNGYEHLSGKVPTVNVELEHMGGVQGERLSNWLRNQNWNGSFDHGSIEWDRSSPPQTYELVDCDGMKLTILGPTRERLEKLITKWEKEVRTALEKGKVDPAILSPGLEVMGREWGGPPTLDTDDALATLADTRSDQDDAEANGSSIVLLLEYDGHSILLTGDAFSSDLVDAIQALSPDGPLALDLVKLPHHGSQNNVHTKLIESVACNAWLISTDGTQFYHPDNEAVARVIQYGRADDRRPRLLFNQSTKYNECWADGDWQQRFGYDTEYGTDDDGKVITFG